MREKQYSFKVTITLEEGDDYTQDEVKEIVEDYLGLGKEIYDGDILAHNGKVIGHVVDGVRGYCFDVVYAIPLFTSTWPLYGVVVNDYKGDVEIVGSIHDKEWQEKLNLKTE